MLVVTSCTGEKQFKPPQPLTRVDFQDSQRYAAASERLQAYQCPAAELYTGVQHRYVMAAVQALRQRFGQAMVDLQILSAGYGLIAADRVIVPYEVTFNQFSAAELDTWAAELQIHQVFERAITSYDLIFVLLGERYLRALALPVETRADQTLIFLTSRQGDRYIPPLTAQVHRVHLSNQDAKRYGCALVGLKGFLLQHFAFGAQSKILNDIQDNPQQFSAWLDTFQPVKQALSKQLSLGLMVEPDTISNSDKSKQFRELPIPDQPSAPNSHFGLQYFIPEWDDLVHPNYDFLTDLAPSQQNFYLDQVYAHEIYGMPNYDGILMSRAVIEQKKSKLQLIAEMGVQAFLRFPTDNIMGDCGAFSYIQEETPPYSIDDVLSFYDSLGFAYGVSVDHLIVGPFAQPGIRERRYDLTLKNAAEFLEKHRARGYQFMPIGVAQGWSPESYAQAVQVLVGMGYEYVGLGGLVRSQNQEIYRILEAVSPHLTAQTRLHLFGVARLETVRAFHHLGVTSVDSASALRKAWLGGADTAVNYHTLSGKKYTAIRVPPVTGTAAKRLIREGRLMLERLTRLEQGALGALRDYDVGRLGLEGTLEAVLSYQEVLDDQNAKGAACQERLAERRLALYREVLSDRPWEQCDCRICQAIGIEVVIFRGNNRNRRRGFHNTYVLYKQLEKYHLYQIS